MGAFLGFVALCVVVYAFVYVIPQKTQRAWFKSLWAAVLIAGAVGLVVEALKRGRLPF